MLKDRRLQWFKCDKKRAAPSHHQRTKSNYESDMDVTDDDNDSLSKLEIEVLEEQKDQKINKIKKSNS